MVTPNCLRAPSRPNFPHCVFVLFSCKLCTSLFFSDLCVCTCVGVRVARKLTGQGCSLFTSHWCVTEGCPSTLLVVLFSAWSPLSFARRFNARR